MQREDFHISCPIPLRDHPQVMLAHGGGGSLMHQLIEKMFLSSFGAPEASRRHDSAVLTMPGTKLAFTTDSYVVHPIIFPGGNIGTLAVNGTVNDLAMSGARPLYISAGFILEEGLPMEDLWKVVRAMRAAADAADVQIVTGDTKVVDKGKGDGIFINTSGIGVIEHGLTIAPSSVKAGDAVIVNGDLARHGMAIMAVREGLEFESEITSDTAPLSGLVQRLLAAGVKVHCLRDLTRGGLASTLNEIATASGRGIAIEEVAVPVREDVAAACEMLGLDPLYVANEGRMAVIVDGDDAGLVMDIMRADPAGQGARLIGRVTDGPAMVTMKSRIGAQRIVDLLSGEQLPRIC